MADPARVFFRNPFYDGQLVRTLAAAPAGSADLGEAMATARRVGRLSGDAWHRAWSTTAQTASRAAEESLAAGDTVSARLAYLRASEYARQAFYFVRSDIDDDRLQSSYHTHVESFRSALELMDGPAHAVQIPYEHTTLRGYLLAPAGADSKRPTVIFPAGYDSTAEAGWVNAPAALERGYNVVLFEGPGQGGALYLQHLVFRPDFEHVLTPLLDWLLARPEVDPSSLVLVGRSFAGYLAPRAAAFEHRIAALVCDPAQPDMGARIPDGFVGKIAAPVATLQTKLSAGRAEFFGARMAGHGLHSLAEYFTELRRFTMIDFAPQITCPTLIVEADNDFAGGGGAQLASKLTDRAALVRLTAQAGGDGHCAGLGQTLWAQTVYAWLARTLNISSDTASDRITTAARR
jgi:dienelactone hydrolase